MIYQKKVILNKNNLKVNKFNNDFCSSINHKCIDSDNNPCNDSIVKVQLSPTVDRNIEFIEFTRRNKSNDNDNILIDYGNTNLLNNDILNNSNNINNNNIIKNFKTFDDKNSLYELKNNDCYMVTSQNKLKKRPLSLVYNNKSLNVIKEESVNSSSENSQNKLKSFDKKSNLYNKINTNNNYYYNCKDKTNELIRSKDKYVKNINININCNTLINNKNDFTKSLYNKSTDDNYCNNTDIFNINSLSNIDKSINNRKIIHNNYNNNKSCISSLNNNFNNYKNNSKYNKYVVSKLTKKYYNNNNNYSNDNHLNNSKSIFISNSYNKKIKEKEFDISNIKDSNSLLYTTKSNSLKKPCKVKLYNYKNLNKNKSNSVEIIRSESINNCENIKESTNDNLKIKKLNNIKSKTNKGYLYNYNLQVSKLNNKNQVYK